MSRHRNIQQLSLNYILRNSLLRRTVSATVICVLLKNTDSRFRHPLSVEATINGTGSEFQPACRVHRDSMCVSVRARASRILMWTDKTKRDLINY